MIAPRKDSPTQSEQYDHKLRSELYACMLKLQDHALEMEYHEDHNDADKLSDVLMELYKDVPKAVAAYFKCIEGGKHV